MNERDLFNAALQIEDPAARAASLDKACGDDIELRQRVEALLEAFGQAGSFMQQPAVAAAATSDVSPPGPSLNNVRAERPGTVIGPYKLLQQIGEGGMGTVFMAEQTQPVQRKVALKIIKPGMDSKQVIARFEAERQALAMMDHVNIARVFDGGTCGAGVPPASDSDAGGTPAPQGRPYFVMELVHGVPITKYCDDNHLTPRERLELFVPVCQAIQHAHQKGIIHRDIKPSNVMVTLYDGKPVPKVIDFGVAKATEQKLTERTLFTQYGTMVGTLEYMSPEQAEMSALGVDTRSDIYSLGVLLYELLTGSTPLTHKRMKEAAYAEILRLIKEEEPPKPSTRLSDSGEALASISAQRHMEPAKLTKLVRGELDWIVMKALEKDRDRRYETANGFAADVQRYLNDEAVQACPPSATYRLRKFVRRNKAGLAVAGMILFFLVLLGSGAGWAVRDRAARDEERARERTERLTKVAGQVELILAEVERLEKEQQWPDALVAARRAQAALAGGEADPDTSERVRQVLADLEMVARLEEIRLSLSEVSQDGRKLDRADTAGRYAAAFREYGVDAEALPADQAAARLRSRTAIVGPLAAALDHWGDCCRFNKDERLAKELWALAGTLDPDPWRVHVRKAVSARDVARLLVLAEPPNTAGQPPQSQVLLAMTLQSSNGLKAIALLERASEAHPADFWIHFQLAAHLNASLRPKRLEAVVRHYTAARALRPRSAATWNNLGSAVHDQKKLDEAIACYRKAIELDPKLAAAHYNLGNALYAQKKLDEAITCYRKAIELDPKFDLAHGNLGNALFGQKKWDDAIACYRKHIELDPKRAGTHNNLGVALKAQGNVNDAIACYRTAIELDPKLGAAHNNLGMALKDQGKVNDAITSYRTAIELDPKNANAHSNLGAILCDHKRDYDGAIAAFLKAIDLDPDAAMAHFNLGNALCGKGQFDEAIARYRKAIKLDPKLVNALLNVGIALYGQGKPDEAIACFRTAIELDPKNANAHSNLGVLLRKKGDFPGAIAAWRKAIALKPDDAGACNKLAWLLATCQDPKFRNPGEAVQLAKRAVDVQPANGNSWKTLGAAQYSAGDWKAARAALEKSMELRKGGDSFDWFFLAMAHWQLGDKEQARKWYDQGVTWMEKNAPQDEELRRFRAEAAALLDLPHSPKGGDVPK